MHASRCGVQPHAGWLVWWEQHPDFKSGSKLDAAALCRIGCVPRFDVCAAHWPRLATYKFNKSRSDERRKGFAAFERVWHMRSTCSAGPGSCCHNATHPAGCLRYILCVHDGHEKRSAPAAAPACACMHGGVWLLSDSCYKSSAEQLHTCHCWQQLAAVAR
jgi:hypothetical protein